MLTAMFDGYVDYRGVVLCAESPLQKGERYGLWFRNSTEQQVRDLRSDPDTGIALQASWELARVPKPKGRSFGRECWTYDAGHVGQFLDFFGERTGCVPPRWWSNALLQVTLFPSEHHAFPLEEQGEWRRLKGFSVSDVPGALLITSRGASVTVGRDSLPWLTSRESPELMFLDEDACLLTTQSVRRGGFGFPMTCIEMATGAVTWHAEVWAAGRTALFGRGCHRAEVVRSGASLVVFGCESHGAYAECFDAADGSCIYRYCSCYWFQQPETWNVPWSEQPPRWQP